MSWQAVLIRWRVRMACWRMRRQVRRQFLRREREMTASFAEIQRIGRKELERRKGWPT